MGFEPDELAMATHADLMELAGQHLGFDIHHDGSQPKKPGIAVKNIKEAGVTSLDDAVAFLGDWGLSADDAIRFAPAVMAKLGWSAGREAGGKRRQSPVLRARRSRLNVPGRLELAWAHAPLLQSHFDFWFSRRLRSTSPVALPALLREQV